MLINKLIQHLNYNNKQRMEKMKWNFNTTYDLKFRSKISGKISNTLYNNSNYSSTNSKNIREYDKNNVKRQDVKSDGSNHKHIINIQQSKPDGKIKQQKMLDLYQIKLDKVPITIIHPLKLFFATILDCHCQSLKLSQPEGKQFPFTFLQQPITIPGIYCMIKQYEYKWDRAYSQQIRYYIIASMWDQGWVTVGQATQWEQIVNHELRAQIQEQSMNNEFYDIDRVRDRHIQHYGKKITNTDINMPDVEYKKNASLNISPQMRLLFEHLQSQYHRQQITLNKLQQIIQASYRHQYLDNINGNKYKQKQLLAEHELYKILEKAIYQVYQFMDTDNVGHIGLQSFINTFHINNNADVYDNEQLLYYMMNKICNNQHIYNSHTNTVTNPHNNAININMEQLDSVRIGIENIMQTINRVYCPIGNMGMDMEMNQHPSLSYNAIWCLMHKYKNMLAKTKQNHSSTLIQQLKQNNKKIQLLAQMQHIRQAAESIVHQPHHHQNMGMNYNAVEQYQTNKQTGSIEQDQQPTFRNTTTVYNKHDGGQTAQKNKHRYIKQQDSQHKLKMQNTAPNTNNNNNTTNTIKSQTPTQTRQSTDKTKYKYKSISINNNNKQQPNTNGNIADQDYPHIRQFTAYKQPQPQTHMRQQMYRKQMEYRAQLENILIQHMKHKQRLQLQHIQYRIQHQLQLIQHMKISNRNKYYDIIYP